MLSYEKRKIICMQNLAKVQKKTGRKKKSGIKRTYRYADCVDFTIRAYAKEHNIKPYMLINTILRDYLVEKKILTSFSNFYSDF